MTALYTFGVLVLHYWWHAYKHEGQAFKRYFTSLLTYKTILQTTVNPVWDARTFERASPREPMGCLPRGARVYLRHCFNAQNNSSRICAYQADVRCRKCSPFIATNFYLISYFLFTFLFRSVFHRLLNPSVCTSSKVFLFYWQMEEVSPHKILVSLCMYCTDTHAHVINKSLQQYTVHFELQRLLQHSAPSNYNWSEANFLLRSIGIMVLFYLATAMYYI